MIHKKSKLLILLLLLLVKVLPLHAYTVFPSCPDFTNIEASYVEPYTGFTYNNPLLTYGLVPGRHTVVDSVGTDPNTGNLLQLLPSGESKVVRLGNTEVGFKTAALIYHFIVDKKKSILQVKFAVVLQDPGHPHADQPRFRIRIMDKNGKLLGDCSEYDVSAASGLPGFQTYDNGLNTPIRWRDWTTLTLDLSVYGGQEVQAEFTSFDCGQGAHYGYAYFTAECINNYISMQSCTGTAVTAVAPSGFTSYLWDNGDKASISTRTLTGKEIPLSCLLVDEMGCSYTINGLITDSVPFSTDETFQDTICQGNSYTKNDFNLPPQNETGYYTYNNTYIDSKNCNGDITTTLQLLIKPRYYKLKASICYGEDYILNGFNIKNPSVGLHRDSLVIPRSGCDSVICLELKVNTSFKTATAIYGNTTVCTDEELIYFISDIDTSATYTWTVPSSATIISGQGTGVIAVTFNQAIGGQISLTGENGCGSVSLSLNVTVNPSYHSAINETICSGNEYTTNGFLLPKQDSVGSFVFINKLQTTAGCDSVTVLSLLVQPTPSISIALQTDSFICAGNTTILNAVSLGASQTIIIASKVMVGDILCTDNTTVKPENYTSSGKTAKGVVFFVDNTGEHGWAAGLNDLPSTYRWSNTHVDIPGLIDYIAPARNYLKDISGYSNTQTIRLFGNATSYPAAYAVDFVNGWYLPAIGQLRHMYDISYIIQSTFALVGGDLLDQSEKYISSTENSANFIWSMNGTAHFNQLNKTSFAYIRPVCSF